MQQQVMYIGKPFYCGASDKEIFPGHLFDVTVHPYNQYTTPCPLSSHIHVQSVKYPQLTIELYDGEYQSYTAHD